MLLINPATEKFGGYLSRYIPVGIPVAVGSIAAYLEKHGIRCNVIDEEFVDITPAVLREKLEGLERPFIIGVSCLTAHIGRGFQIARMIRAEFPDATIVFGGLHPTALPDESLNIGVIDYVVRGEGEEIMLRLHRAIRGDGDPTKLLGVSYRRDGRNFHNPESPLMPDLDAVPPFPYHFFENPKYDMGFLTTSRGCPYRCSYCSQRLLTGTTYRYKSAPRIVEELEVLVDRYHQKAVAFYDDNFCLKASRVLELCDLIIERGLHRKVKLSVQTRADNLVFHGGEEVIRRMAEAGFDHVGFGMETGVQRLADLVMKDETVETHLEGVRLCKKHGIKVSLFMIFGLPTETARDREESFALVQSQNLLASKYNNLIPYPGTPIFTDLKATGRVFMMPNWTNFNSTLSVTRSIFDKTPLPYVPETTSEFELKREIIKYNFKAYVNLDSLAGIFGHTKGPGWYRLPERWYLQPRELYEMTKVGVQAAINFVVAMLPLGVTEPVMNWLNPAMKRRPRIASFDPASHQTSDWDETQTKRKIVLLKKARDELKATGSFDVTVGQGGGLGSEIGAPLAANQALGTSPAE